MQLSDDRWQLLERLICQSVPVAASNAPGPASHIEPASYAQRRLWFLEQLQQTEVPYTLHAMEHLAFAITPPVLERAVNEIVRRHEVLRTTFVLHDGEPMQNIAAEVHVPLRIVDLSGLSAAERRPEALGQMGLTIARRFDLERGPLLRTELYHFGARDWLFLLAVHHIVFDGPSFHIFFQELESIYGAMLGNVGHALPAPKLQYAEFAREQRRKLTPQRIAEEVGFWRDELAGVPMLDLPVDRQRSPVPSFRGGQMQFEVSPDVVAKLQQRAAAGKTTLFTVLLAGLCAALSRLCGQDDFALGLPVTGRDSAERQVAIGFFVDTVVVRPRFQGDPSTGELIETARAALNRSLSHRALPFEVLVQHLHPERELGVNPYFQVGFQLMLQPAVTADAEGLDIARSSSMFDLGLDLWLQDKAIRGRLQFNTDLFDPPGVERALGTFHRALEWLTGPQHRLSELQVGSSGDSDDLAVLRGETLEFEERSCLELIGAIAQRHPGAIALEGSADRLTYRQMMDRVAHWCGALVARGVTPGSLVALELPRSLGLACLQLAVMQAGAAFVVLDPACPLARRDEILEDVQPKLLIDACALATLHAASDAAPVMTRPDRGDAAYVIFTSGSTGRPKGVVVEHGGLINVAHVQRQRFGLAPGRRVAQLASPTFDASVFEIMLALGAGATLVVAPQEILAGEDLARFLDGNDVDAIVIPPTILASVEPSACPSLRLVCVAGENCPSDLADRWRGHVDFWNLYGPTEATIWATCGRDQFGSRVSIGRPIPNLTTVVVDANLRVVPVGVAGELCIAGIGLARGYLNRPALTAERFVMHARDVEQRLYRTGDLVRQMHAGELVFLGRVDRQVKVRGFRIEPEEIEIVLRSHPLVEEAVAVARSIDGGSEVLIAYVQCGGDANGVVEECRRLVRERLPLHMWPSHYVVVAGVPRMSSGKIDIRTLPLPAALPPAGNGYVEPVTPTERRIAELMARVAHVPRVGASEDFFHIGGHSLAAAQLVAHARAAFKVDLTIRDVFQYSTVCALAERIDALAAQAGSDRELEEVALVRLPRGREGA